MIEDCNYSELLESDYENIRHLWYVLNRIANTLGADYNTNDIVDKIEQLKEDKEWMETRLTELERNFGYWVWDDII